MKGKSHKSAEARIGACLDDDQLYRYLEKLANEDERQKIERHLNSCNNCLSDFAMLARSVHAPAAEAERVELARLPKLTPDEQMAKILTYLEAEHGVAGKEEAGIFPLMRNALENVATFIGNIFSQPSRVWKPAVALASVMILFVLIGRPIYNARQSNALTDGALSRFVANYQIDSRDVPRPKGDFAYSVLGGRTRSPGENPLSRFETVKNDFQKALHLNAQNAAAHQYLGTYYLLIERDLRQAEEQYRRALAQDSVNAGIINDLGVLAFYQGAYDEAAERFVRALKYNPGLLEAQYNLTIIYQLQGKRKEAIEELAKYLQQDSTLIWADVAKNRLRLLRQDRP